MSIEAKWCLHVRPEPDTGNDEESYRRLRAFLKCALRSYGIRCVTITKPEATDTSDTIEGGN